MNPDAVIAATKRWISSFVIGLNLCPFAQRVFEGDRIRYVVTDAADVDTLRDALAQELRFLVDSPIDQVETTLLIHPNALGDFLAYNEFLDIVEDVLQELRLAGVVQVATFHPAYQFADSEPDEVENFTNRSPYPMLHLLREESVTRVASDPDELLEIPERNMATLRKLGAKWVQEKMKEITNG
jgi:hypothetical protein